MVLNGEIYNFRELRRQLTSEGHVFRSSGDTEVIAHLAEALSPVQIARTLDGMFALAVWDCTRKRLVLARDRVGKKPLYYSFANGRLVFGSEIKAVLADPTVARCLNPRAIPAYLTFGYVPTPETFFDGVKSVPPGQVLVFEDGEVRLESYWSLPLVKDAGDRLDISLQEAASGVRTRLRKAVERRLVSDAPLGAFLSGGIDSSAIVGLMSEVMSGPVSTFTIGFDDKEGFDERPYAHRIAQRFRTEHHEFVIDPAAVDLVERLVWHHDQPFGDSSAVPTFLLSQLTKQHVTVALSGDGGDELFAGYERFAAARAVSTYERAPRVLRDSAETVLGRLPSAAAGGRVGSLHRFAARAHLGLPDAYRSWLSYVPDQTHRELIRGADDWGWEDYRRTWRRSEGACDLDRLLDLNFRTYLLDDLLPKVDRMSMAHGLEVRSPFLDAELIEYAARIPSAHKLRGITLKRVLKRAVGDLMPAELLTRRKRGFGVPLRRWFREDLTGYVDATLGARDARVRHHLCGDTIDRLILEHRANRQDHGHALWMLLTLEVFLRRERW